MKRGQTVVCVNNDFSPGQTNYMDMPLLTIGERYTIISTFEYGTQVSLVGVVGNWGDVTFHYHFNTKRFVSLTAYAKMMKEKSE